MPHAQRLLSRILVLSSVAVLAACSSEGGNGPSGGAGGGGGAAAVTCDTDYTKLANHVPVSLKDDLMPLMGLGCTIGSECHNSADTTPMADLKLGYKCDFDDKAKWGCTFPATPTGADPLDFSQPLTQAIVDEVHAALLLSSATVPSVKRVDPGHPEKSFLLDKLADTQNDKPYTAECTNKDTRAHDPNDLCGTFMPQSGKALCFSKPPSYNPANTGQVKFDMFAAWILQGALNN